MLRPLVADAPALAEYLLGTAAGLPIGEIVEAAGVELHVPALCDVELVDILRSAMLSGGLRPRRAAQVLQDYLDLPIVRHEHGPLLARVLALRANFLASDAIYVALSERLGAALVTGDEGMASLIRKHTELEVLTPTG